MAGEFKILNTNDPEVLALRANRAKNGGKATTADERIAQLAGESENAAASGEGGASGNGDRGKDIDWTKWVSTVGGGLLGHSLMSAIIDKPRSVKDSIWVKALREIAKLGAGAAGAYGGYMFGKNAEDGHSPNLYNEDLGKWVSYATATNNPGYRYTDPAAEKRNAGSVIPQAATSVLSLGGGVATTPWAFRRWEDFLHGTPIPRGKDRVVPPQWEGVEEKMERVRSAQEELSEATANVEGRAQRDAIADANDATHTRKENAHQQDVARQQQSTGRGRRGGKLPPTPWKEEIPRYTPKGSDRPPADVRSDIKRYKADLKRSLGWRAGLRSLLPLSLYGIGALTGYEALDNYSENRRLDEELKSRGVDPTKFPLR